MKNSLQKFLIFSTLVFLVMPVSLLMIQNVKAIGNDWQQPIGYDADVLLSNNTNVYTGDCVADPSEFVGSSYSANGALNWSLSNTSNPLPCPSQQDAAIDSSGAIYTVASSTQPNDWTEHITKYTNGRVVWDTVPPNAQTILALSLGADGNLYAVTDSTSNMGGSIGLLGLSPVPTAGETAPQIILDEPLNIQAGNFSGFSVYNNGLVVSSRANGVSGELLQYFGYDGSTQSSMTIPNPGAVDVFAATLDGRMFVPQVGTTTSHCTPDPTGYADESGVIVYGPAGQQWTYALPSCSVVYAVRPTSDDGVVLWINRNGTKQLLLSVDGNGTPRWPQPLSIGGSSGGISYALNALYVTIAGDIATVENYTQSDNNKGVIISLYSGSDGSQLWAHEFVPTANQGGYTYGNGGNQSFAIAQGMVYILIESCTYSTNGGAPGCGGQTLYGLNANGMELDYPRGAILAPNQPLPTPSPTVCPSVQFVGVRGSGENGKGYYGGYGKDVGAIKDDLLKSLPNMATMAIAYPAVPVSLDAAYPQAYYSSASKGIDALWSFLIGFTQQCPTTPLIIVGYSQGADVAGHVAQALPEIIQKQVAALVLLGDPLFNSLQPAVDIKATKYNPLLMGIYVGGLAGLLPRQIPSELVPKTASYCLAGDIVCNFPGSPACIANQPSCSHYHYDPYWTGKAATWILARLKY